MIFRLFHVLTIVNSSTMNTGVHVSFYGFFPCVTVGTYWSNPYPSFHLHPPLILRWKLYDLTLLGEEMVFDYVICSHVYSFPKAAVMARDWVA